MKNYRKSGSIRKIKTNIYSNEDVKCQNVSVALMLSEMLLKENGVSRVHGGGFAGTIQAFVSYLIQKPVYQL